MAKGRKPNTEKLETINNLFKNSKNRKEFTAGLNEIGLKTTSATTMWYKLCKENDRKVVERRGRVPQVKVDPKVTLAIALINEAISKKQSTIGCRKLLEVLA